LLLPSLLPFWLSFRSAAEESAFLAPNAVISTEARSA